MQPMPRIIYEFGPFRLDAHRHALSRSGQPVSLPPKAFEILLLLLENRDNLLSKTDLLSRVWPNAFVEENNLAQHVSLLRKTLGENHEKPLYVETVPRVGYRFIGEVRMVESGHANGDVIATISGGKPSGNDTALRPRRGTNRIPIPALLLAACTIAVLLVFLFWRKPSRAVVDYVQLTRDGYPKIPPLMTDGEFVYFTEVRAGVNTLVRVPIQGGEPIALSGIPVNIEPLDLSPIRHQILAVGARTYRRRSSAVGGSFAGRAFSPTTRAPGEHRRLVASRRSAFFIHAILNCMLPAAKEPDPRS